MLHKKLTAKEKGLAPLDVSSFISVIFAERILRFSPRVVEPVSASEENEAK